MAYTCYVNIHDYKLILKKDVLPQILSSFKIIVIILPEYLPAESVRIATTRDLRGNSIKATVEKNLKQNCICLQRLPSTLQAV